MATAVPGVPMNRQIQQALDNAVQGLALLDPEDPNRGGSYVARGLASSREEWLAYLLKAIERQMGEAELEQIRDLCAGRLESGRWEP